MTKSQILVTLLVISLAVLIGLLFYLARDPKTKELFFSNTAKIIWRSVFTSPAKLTYGKIYDPDNQFIIIVDKDPPSSIHFFPYSQIIGKERTEKLLPNEESISNSAGGFANLPEGLVSYFGGNAFLVRENGSIYVVTNDHVLESTSFAEAWDYHDHEGDVTYLKQLQNKVPENIPNANQLKVSRLTPEEQIGRKVRIISLTGKRFTFIMEGEIIGYFDGKLLLALKHNLPTEKDHLKFAFEGASGSPVIDTETDEVIGIFSKKNTMNIKYTSEFFYYDKELQIIGIVPLSPEIFH